MLPSVRQDAMNEDITTTESKWKAHRDAVRSLLEIPGYRTTSTSRPSLRRSGSSHEHSSGSAGGSRGTVRLPLRPPYECVQAPSIQISEWIGLLRARYAAPPRRSTKFPVPSDRPRRRGNAPDGRDPKRIRDRLWRAGRAVHPDRRSSGWIVGARLPSRTLHRRRSRLGPEECHSPSDLVEYGNHPEPGEATAQVLAKLGGAFDAIVKAERRGSVPPIDLQVPRPPLLG